MKTTRRSFLKSVTAVGVALGIVRKSEAFEEPPICDFTDNVIMGTFGDDEFWWRNEGTIRVTFFDDTSRVLRHEDFFHGRRGCGLSVISRHNGIGSIDFTDENGKTTPCKRLERANWNGIETHICDPADGVLVQGWRSTE